MPQRPGAALCLVCARVAWHIPAIKAALDLSMAASALKSPEFTLVKIALPEIYLFQLHPRQSDHAGPRTRQPPDQDGGSGSVVPV